MSKPIQINNLSISYGEYNVIQNFSLFVNEGETVLIKGASGCGKSTLLHAICGLIPSVIKADITGEVLLYGKNVKTLNIADRAREIGIVFQNPETQLFCDTVEDEIAFGLENICTPTHEIGERINKMLTLVNMEKHRLTSPRELSGGQKQRVVLASVLALHPRILLLDEAMSQLDQRGRESLTQHIIDLQKQNITMLLVDHDEQLESIATYCVDLEDFAL